MTTRSFLASVREFMGHGGSIDKLKKEVAEDWLDDMRDRIAAQADRDSASLRDYAATLVAVLVSPTRAAVVHVGDGGCVFRMEEDTAWRVLSWPAHGEFASTTYFVTDQPQAALRFESVEYRIGEVSVFTDGLERLLLEFSSRSAFSPFFDRAFANFSEAIPGRHRPLSTQMKNLLSSDLVNARTDDDKTLILASRRTQNV